MSAPAVIHDATIVTADDAGAIHYDAALVVQDRRIAAIGPAAEVLARHPEADRVARAAWRRLLEQRPDLPRPPGLDVGG